MAERFPHRAKLRASLVQNRDSARSQIPGSDPYSAKQLERYANAMQSQIDVVDSMKEEYVPDPE